MPFEIGLKLKKLNPLIPLLIGINLLLVGIYLVPKSNHPANPVQFKASQINHQPQNLPELAQFKNPNLTFEQLSRMLQLIARQKGADYAYEVLKQAPLPPNTDTHLLGHVVGDELYKQQGADGIRVCTQDFRNACSHAIVVGLLLDKGEAGLNDIRLACQKAPGGSGAYTMCFHGLGHGVLAFNQYDFPKTVTMCQKTGTAQYNDQEAVQCIGGAVMEIISGGGHDHEIWAQKRPLYLKPNDPLYLCQADFMPENAKTMCLDYLTPWLWEAVGADMGHPQTADFVKANQLCNLLPANRNDLREACFGGFGKEYVTLAQDRDIRRIDQMNETQMSQVYQWCDLAPTGQAKIACLTHALSSFYWGGENDPHAAVQFCSIVPNPNFKASCFESLFSQVSYYIKDPNYYQMFCNLVPTDFKQRCQSNLRI